MTSIAYALLAVTTSALADEPPPVRPPAFVQLRIQQRVIVRVRAMPVPSLPVPLPRVPVVWREKRGPSCVPMNLLAGAAVTQADAVDLYLRGGERMRARLDDDCPALDYYLGFYVVPNKDGQICAGRDVIRTRSGGQCEIVKFRRLMPAKERAQR